MDKYKIIWDKKSLKDLKSIDKYQADRVIRKTEELLAADPYVGDKLKGDLKSFYRIRIGDYRVVYEIVNDTIEVIISRVGHRKEIYDFNF